MSRAVDAVKCVEEWVQSISGQGNMLWNIPIAASRSAKHGVGVSAKFLSETLGISYDLALECRAATAPLIDAMVEEGVVLPGHGAGAIEKRRQLLVWYRSLGADEKKALPLRGKKIDCSNTFVGDLACLYSAVMRYPAVREAFASINQDLVEVRGLNPAPKRNYHARRQIKGWVKNVSEDVDALWRIPLTRSKSSLGVGVSAKFLQSTLGITPGAAHKYRHLADSVIEKMVTEGIVVLGHGAAAIEKRRMLLCWFRSLGDEEKKALPTFGNAINIKRVFSGDLKPLADAKVYYKLVKEAFAEINQSLMDLGVLDPDYLAVKERGLDSRSHLWVPAVKQETQLDRNIELSKQPLNNIQDLVAPSDERPYVQVEQLFAVASNSVSSESAKSNFFDASESLKKYFWSQYGDNKVLLFDLLDGKRSAPPTGEEKYSKKPWTKVRCCEKVAITATQQFSQACT